MHSGDMCRIHWSMFLRLNINTPKSQTYLEAETHFLPHCSIKLQEQKYELFVMLCPSTYFLCFLYLIFGSCCFYPFFCNHSSTKRCRYFNQRQEQYADAFAPTLPRDPEKKATETKGSTRSLLAYQVFDELQTREQKVTGQREIQLTSVRTIHDDFDMPSRHGAPWTPETELDGAFAGGPRQPGPAAGVSGIRGYWLQYGGFWKFPSSLERRRKWLFSGCVIH